MKGLSFWILAFSLDDLVCRRQSEGRDVGGGGIMILEEDKIAELGKGIVLVELLLSCDLKLEV